MCSLCTSVLDQKKCIKPLSAGQRVKLSQEDSTPSCIKVHFHSCLWASFVLFFFGGGGLLPSRAASVFITSVLVCRGSGRRELQVWLYIISDLCIVSVPHPINPPEALRICSVYSTWLWERYRSSKRFPSFWLLPLFHEHLLSTTQLATYGLEAFPLGVPEPSSLFSTYSAGVPSTLSWYRYVNVSLLMLWLRGVDVTDESFQ